MSRWVRRNWGYLWFGLRYPLKEKTAWILVGTWTLCLATVVLAAILDIIWQRWGWLLWQGVVGIFDFVMLHRALEGLLWRRSLDKWLTARIAQG